MRTAVKVTKKVTIFWENIRPGQCDPYRQNCSESEKAAAAAGSIEEQDKH